MFLSQLDWMCQYVHDGSLCGGKPTRQQLSSSWLVPLTLDSNVLLGVLLQLSDCVQRSWFVDEMAVPQKA